ncbi:NUDIX hydrolase [Actinocorallia sp. A-T 12471]|uniref:NUDIX hydrolase n=1 Tax=Actinocorallia sp. A-T 12471 TaxID=3089813 RepID=UPI0029CF4F31|nr:NUDIX hydrolase [Actinocorallia sp. A-T 12471]MDX6741726.1 NUDIX hydrolase [Actinocorallia sp. A-T 12471]
MTQPYLPPAQWYETLPTVYVSVVVLLTDADDQVLMVKPNYRGYWQIPGGIIEHGEAPHETAEREVVEELGLKPDIGRLLVIDFVPAHGDRPRPMMNFLFDGGTVTDPAQIRVQNAELDGHGFFAWDEAAALLPTATAARIPAARTARATGQTLYLPAQP